MKKLHKAAVRKVPSFLSEEEFFRGLNIDLPVEQRYFVPSRTK